jgi:hypothetical protein
MNISDVALRSILWKTASAALIYSQDSSEETAIDRAVKEAMRELRSEEKRQKSEEQP